LTLHGDRRVMYKVESSSDPRPYGNVELLFRN
jgi:hypothetical protein